MADPIADAGSFIWGGTSGTPTYAELQRRRAIAVALASRARGYPKTVGEGMTYLGEAIGDTLADRRLTAMERASAAAFEREQNAPVTGTTYRPSSTGAAGNIPGAAPPSAPAPAAPAVRPPTTRAGPAMSMMSVTPLSPDPSGATEGASPEFAPGGILNPVGMTADAAPGALRSGYLNPAATTAPPPSPAPVPPAAAAPAPSPQSFSGDAPPNVLAKAQEVALQGGPAAVSKFMADAGYPKSGAWCGQFAASVLSTSGVAPPAHAGIASNFRSIGDPVSGTPQIGDIAIARPGWAPRRGTGETGDTGSHVTFVNQAAPEGTFQGLGGNQGSMFRNFDTRDFEFRRLPGDVQGRRIIGIPGEGSPAAQDDQISLERPLPQRMGEGATLASGRAGVMSDAPPPGIGSAGGNIRFQSDPFQPPAGVAPEPLGAPLPPGVRSRSPGMPDEQITPTDITPMPSTAQFGPPVGRFTQQRSDAPVMGAAPPSSVPAAAAAPAATASPPQPRGPATYVGSQPGTEPIPPAQAQTMEPPGAAPVRQFPSGRPLSQEQEKQLRIKNSPYASPEQKQAAEDKFKIEESYRLRHETQDESDYARLQTQHFQKTHEFEKFQREAYDRNIKQLGDRLGLAKTQADIEKMYFEQGLPRQQALDKARLDIERLRQQIAVGAQELRAGKAPTHATMNDVSAQWDQESGQWKEIKVQKLPDEGGPPNVKLTKEQSDEIQHLTKIQIALDQFGRIRDGDKILAEGLRDELAGKVPFAGNALLHDKYREAKNAMSNFIQGHLRSTSGAAIGAQEMATHYANLVAIYGDDANSIRNKAQLREGIKDSMYFGLGTARPLIDYAVKQRQEKDAAEQTKIRGEMPANPEVGRVYKNEKGQRRYWTGSRWEND